MRLFSGIDEWQNIHAFIGDDALTVTVDRNSYAERYCEANGIRYIYSDPIDWMAEFDKYFK